MDILDILDKLKNAVVIFNGLPNLVSMCQEAVTEIEALRKKTIPDGYVLMRKTTILETHPLYDPPPLI